MIQFFQTILGKRFFESQMPQLIKSLVIIGEQLKRANDLKEKEVEK